MKSNTVLLHGDCLELMQLIPDKSVDMILCDLPYGTTACKWDVIIPFDKLWKQYERVIKDNGAIVLFGSEPFSSHLRLSNLKLYKYDWVWNKVNRFTGMLNSNKMPMLDHEDAMVFYKKQPTYNKQLREGSYKTRQFKGDRNMGTTGRVNIMPDVGRQVNGLNPIRIISFPSHTTKKCLHPTQKPVPLLEYLIKTYTNTGELVLDNTMGSGSTGVACVNTDRDFIGIEKDDKYFAIAQERIAEAQSKEIKEVA